MTDESGAVRAELMIHRVGDRQIWRWSIGSCAVLLSFPIRGEGFTDEDARDLDFLIHHVPELVTTGATEAEIEMFKREMEDEL